MKNTCLTFLIVSLFVMFSPSSIHSQDLFSKYNWLQSKVDQYECGELLIAEYDLGPYAFVTVILDEVEKFYFQDGTLFCNGNQSYDCVAAYGLTGLETQTYLTSFTTNCDNEEMLSDKYPWLDNIIDLNNCQSGSVDEYLTGFHRFLNVVTPNSAKLYYQNGSLFCTSSPGYDCVSLYGFNQEDIMASQSCGVSVTGPELAGTYTIDLIKELPCDQDYSLGLGLDLVGTGENCTVIDSIENCLFGEIEIREEGSWDIWFRINKATPGNIIDVTGGSGGGNFEVNDEQFYYCETLQDSCNINAGSGRIEFEMELEFCPVRVGGFKK